MSDLDGFLKHYLSTEGKDEEVEKLIERWEKWKQELPTEGIFPKLPFDDRELEYLASEILDGLKYVERCRIFHVPLGVFVDNLHVCFNHSCILRASIGGHLKAVKWLLERYPQYTDWYYHGIFLTSAQMGHLDIVKWSSTLFPLSEVHNYLDGIFREACKKGDFEIAKWIHANYPELDPHSNNEYAFRKACEGNHTVIVKWLLETFPEIATHYRNQSLGWHPFVEVCRLGHLRTAKLLYEKMPHNLFGSAPVTANSLFGWACSNGHLELLMWLYEVFPDIDPHAQDCEAFRKAYDNDRMDIIRWFLDKFPDRYTGDLTARDPWVEYRTKLYVNRHVS